MKFILLVALFSLNTFAVDICEFKAYKIGKINLQTGKLAADNCFLKISGHTVGNAFRSHLFTQKGLYQIFNAFENYQTGAKEYWFNGFEKLGLSITTSNDLIIYLKAGMSIKFNSRLALIEDMTGGKVIEESEILPRTYSGVEILSSVHSFIDFNFSLGRSPRAVLNSNLIFNLKGRLCSFPVDDFINQKSSHFPWKQNLARTFKTLVNSCR